MPNDLTIAEADRLLDLSVVNGDLLALVTVNGDPSTGGTEVTGGSYGRQAMTFASAASAAKSNSAAASFTVPTCSIQGWELWDSAGTSRKWFGLWAPQVGPVDGTANTITIPSHGYAANQKITFKAGYCPSLLSAGVTYYVVNPTTNTFQVATTSGGSAASLGTGPGYGVVVGVVYDLNSGDTFAVDASDLTLDFL